jgi:hypothetical protein
MREIRHWSLKEQADAINQVLRGQYGYYGLAGNLWSIRKTYCRVTRYWYKMLCSRSWRGRFTWEVFNLLDGGLAPLIPLDNRGLKRQPPQLRYPQRHFSGLGFELAFAVAGSAIDPLK